MRTVLVSLTMVSMGLHAVFGCHWHSHTHAHTHAPSCVHQEKPTTPKRGCCHHHHHQGEDQQPSSDESSEQQPSPHENCPDHDHNGCPEHGPNGCPDDSCVWTTPSLSDGFSMWKLLLPVESGLVVQLELLINSAQSDLSTSKFCNSPFFGPPSAVRLHLLKQLWLL